MSRAHECELHLCQHTEASMRHCVSPYCSPYCFEKCLSLHMNFTSWAGLTGQQAWASPDSVPQCWCYRSLQPQFLPECWGFKLRPQALSPTELAPKAQEVHFCICFPLLCENRSLYHNSRCKVLWGLRKWNVTFAFLPITFDCRSKNPLWVVM